VLFAAGCGGATEVPAEPQGADQGPEVDWDEPLVNGSQVSTEEEAALILPFDPAVPTALGQPTKLLVTDPASAELSERVMAIIYDHPTYGRFWIVEALSEMTQGELEALAECSPVSDCEGIWSLVTLGDGTTALQIEGPIANSVVWLEGQVEFDVLGPSATFSAAYAIEVANTV
jgi:hypothetical protein